ncbi:zinc ribbon domain-containing protein [Salinactinospora qingdaonensis]|uniref:C4-type zinc ribbon domain-containing protein n=1 Tax=Salinactinospora qingdaonensis TaxID=702744 RepID=A0ABP7F082_9ACTN
MKAEPVHQRRLLDVQDLDTALGRVAHRRRTMPEATQVQELDARLSELRDALAAADTALADIDREQRKAESDVEQVRTRTDRDSRRLDAGQVSSPKELESLQSEIDSLRRRQSELEEIVLEIMERREAAEERRSGLQRELEEATATRATAEERRAAALAELKAEESELQQQREQAAAEIPDDLLALYTKLRDQYAGVGAAALRQGRCEGCKLALSTAELSEIRTALSDEVVRCEQCRRILVRTPESGL